MSWKDLLDKLRKYKPEDLLEKLRKNKLIVIGLTAGVLITVVTVLASGFMVETTNTDTFCVTCHAMMPSRISWQDSVHGGQNPQGFRAQCVDCHLPHGNFIEYFATKAATGTGDVLQNIFFDPQEFDWAGNAEKNRTHFTYDSACRRCHHNLNGPGLSSGGFIAHRAYLRGKTDKKCVSCHPHVGHKDLIETTVEFFGIEKERI